MPPALVGIVWPQIEPMVERGLRHGAGDTTTKEDIRESIERGRMVMWAVHDSGDVIAVIVLEVVRRPAKTVLRVVMIAGRRFNEWSPTVQRLLEDYRDLIGADEIEAVVRDGLTKWLADLGWKRKATIMRLT